MEDIERVVADERQIAKKVEIAARWLDERFAKAVEPVAICVLKGSAFFFCDLVRAMKTPVLTEFITLSSYGDGTCSTGAPKLVADLSSPVAGKDAIIVEDIIDSGNTLVLLKELLFERGAKSVTCVALFDKPARRQKDVKADFSCFETGDEFLVGYGLDYAQRYRTLPYVGVLKREVYAGKK